MKKKNSRISISRNHLKLHISVNTGQSKLISFLNAFCFLLSAISDYKKAQEIHDGHRRVQEGLKRAEKLLKQSQKRDYYKILGVKR